MKKMLFALTVFALTAQSYAANLQNGTVLLNGQRLALSIDSGAEEITLGSETFFIHYQGHNNIAGKIEVHGKVTEVVNIFHGDETMDAILADTATFAKNYQISNKAEIKCSAKDNAFVLLYTTSSTVGNCTTLK